MNASALALSVSNRMMWPFGRAARRLGVTTDMGTAGMTRAQTASGAVRVSWVNAMAGLDALVKFTGRRDLGIVAARLARLDDLGTLGRAVAAQSTLGDALTISDRHIRLLFDGVIVERAHREDSIVRYFRATSGAALPTQVVDFGFGLLIEHARYLAEDAVPAPARVHFQAPPPDDPQPYYDFFQCPIVFGAGEDSMEVSNAVLTRPSRFADSFEAELFGERLADELAALPPQTLEQRVRDYIASRLSGGAPKSQEAARALGMSTRQLNRKLSESDLTYQSVLDALRAELAVHTLTATGKPIADIAENLGFASVHSFHRAFRRVTGRTPASVRSGGDDDQSPV